MSIKKHRNRVVLLATLICSTFWACSDKNEWPDEPVINDVRFDLDELKMYIDFTDGDGNFGHTAGDPDFPEYFVEGEDTIYNPYYYNLWVEYYELHDGEWEIPELFSTFNFIIPDLTPQGQTKQLEVTATYDLYADITALGADSIKFQVILVDRDQNESLPEETGLLVIPD